jgi:hypothetical protein
MRLPAEASQVVARIAREIAGVREERKAFALILRSLVSLLGCRGGALFFHSRATDSLHKVKALGQAKDWDMETVVCFFRNQKPELGPDTIMAPVRAGDDVVGVVVLSSDGGFKRGAGKVATEILRTVGRLIGSRREIALLEAESAIARAILRGVAPKDVAYRIFHELRRFIDYDHGATLVERLDSDTGRVAARQVAWTKGKSDIVGMTVPFPWPDLPSEPRSLGADHTLRELARLLGSLKEGGAPHKSAILVGPLFVEGHRAGCVEVSSRRPNFFLDKDTHILTRFLPYLSWCVKRWNKSTGGCDE